jgi:hypothetical protein
VCLGDWRQTPPVVKNGNVSDVCKASILNSNLWHLFEKYTLSINMRIFGLMKNSNEYDQRYIKNQTDYAKMLLYIGEGTFDNKLVLEINNNNIIMDTNNCFISNNDNIFDI